MYISWGINEFNKDHNAVIVRTNKRKIDFIKEKCHIIKKEELPSIMEKK